MGLHYSESKFEVYIVPIDIAKHSKPEVLLLFDEYASDIVGLKTHL
jgi:hypothetical protein